MRPRVEASELVIGITPAGEPSARLCASVSGARALGVLDLGRGDRKARDELALTARLAQRPFGIRVTAGCALGYQRMAAELGEDLDRIGTVVLGWHSPWRAAQLPAGCRVLAEVTSVAEAVSAAAAGAHGLIARGNEAAGRVGEFSSFVLLQRLLGDNRVDLPIWLCGGIGVHTAAAAVIGGAVGVVLDTQLALLPEADLPAEAIAAIAASDGSDTAVLGGHRVHAGSPVGTADADTAAATMTEAEVAAALGGRDLATQLLPLGQDAFLATRFSEKYGTAARSIGAVRRAITDTVRAGSLSLLAPGAPLARALGTELPVAQGPMTRVSDQAGFAASVAEHGALPFIALALASGEQTRTLLAETKVALGEKPWGVGVLGFAPEDVRAAQLDVIRESRPSVALIAGGHPAQAAELEAEGITTFLHVASPRLLRQFVEAGARRFVFEGAECGGHVGPRSSFSLWEAQIGVLLDCLDSSQRVDGLSVLFAGGVHDHRSAAIVSALAEPLAGRGVAVGVLMGTGYLFTEEAVSHGAVQPQFQRQVLAAEDTALLETAPGHATRCLATPFAESFRAISHDLTAQGLPKRQVWEELEALNVGRLRIASKGLRREGADLVAVSEAGQLTEGLFMAGQVVALRSRVTTVAKLHESVTRGAMAFREEREQDLRTRLGISEWQAELAPPPADVAIVGMACVFPGAPDLASFWANIVGKVDAVTEVPEERWPAETYFAQGARRGAGDSTPSKWGGFLPKVPFDALRYGIPPATLAAIEPVQLLALEVAQRALTDAGYGEGGFDRSRASVVFGAESGSDLSNAATLRMVLPSYLGELPASLEGQLPKLTEDSFPGSLSNVIAGRIANRLDLGGANYTVDAACAASLAALDAACHELVGETSDLVLCGGADLHNAINDYLLFSAVGALSPSGRCRTFDESADGIALGEGVACVALKRLTDAERDGDRIYAVVEGVGKASDGKSLGLTAPRPEGQRRALHRAYLNAGISPAQVGMIEAHGTGTAVGDRTELETLDAMFAEAGAEEGSCALGSVKSQIGHTKCAAGLAGLIKAAMAVHTGVKPPTLHISRPNPAWREGASPFAFHGNAAPWTRPPEERVAGVSAFGFGGTNFHVVLRGHGSAETVRHGLHEWPVELFTFRGKDHALACREVERLRTLIATNDAHGRPWRLRDLARTASVWADRGRGPVQIAVVAGDLDELATLLGDAISGTPRPTGGLFLAAGSADEGSGKLAVVFPGQGSQRPGMVAELAVVFPEVQRFARLSHQVASAMFPPTAFGAQARAGQAERLRDTRMAQPAMGIAGLAMNHLLARLDVRPDMVAGHSYGELVALAAAGSFDADTLLCISAERADAILDAAGSDSGGMAAVAAEPADVERVLTEAGVSGEVVAANYNAPRQIVISGPTPQLERALTALRSAGLPAKQLPVACAFHSPVVREAGSRFAEMLAKYRFAPPELPVWSNRTAGVYGQTAMAVRDELAAQIGSPVRFVYQIEAMYAAGARVFFEPGPGKVLGRLIDTILGDRPHTMVNCEGTAGTGLRGFLSAVAQLAVAGVELRTGWLTSGRDAVDVSTVTPLGRPGWTVDGHLVRTADGQPLAGGLAPARRIPEVSMPDNSIPQAPPAAGPDREALVSEFLQSSRELVAAQRDVLLGVLGAAPVAPAVTARQQPPTAVAEVTPIAEPSTVAEPVAAAPADVLATVVGLIAERTGYPASMIEPDLDLEADLSVDSIKRTEIAGELCARLGVGGGDARFADLVKTRTARAMADCMAVPDGEAATMTDTAADIKAPSSGLGEAPRRFLQPLVDAGDDVPLAPVPLAGRHFVVCGGEAGVAEPVSALLREQGARVSMSWPPSASAMPEAAAPDSLDGMVFLDALHSGDEPVLPSAVPALRSALRAAPQWLLAIAPTTGHVDSVRAAGMRGLFRTIAEEHPDTVTRLVEVDPATTGDRVAAMVLRELSMTGRQPVVVVDERGRRAFSLRSTALPVLAETGAGPAADHAAEAAAMGLDKQSVLLLIGGARGITARFARALAMAAGCRIELVGRTVPASATEHPDTAAARDLPGLRAALASMRSEGPAGIDSAARQILAQREVADTIRELRRYGGGVNYHAVDVRDHQAIRQLVKQVHAEHGRIDGVIYAAGVIEDRLLLQKDQASFDRVYGTKVDGASALLAELAQLPGAPGFVVLFGSIAAAAGNRGQADYAAANDALQTIGEDWAARTGNRTLTVHWGPWAPSDDHSGMVTAELGRDYARRGVALIDPRQGVASLLRELAWGPPEVTSVVYTASAPWTAAGDGTRQ